jgi:hypothetical protein
MHYLTMRAKVDNARARRTLKGRLNTALDEADTDEDREAIQAEFDAEIDRRIDERQERGGR